MSDLESFQPHLDRRPPQGRVLARAGARLPRAEPRRQDAPRLADRRSSRPSASTSRRNTQRIVELVERIMPNLSGKVKLYDKPYPIFEEYGVQAEIEKALQSKVWLKSGGSIVINQTEALVAVDVNTGRYVGKKSGRPPRGHDRQDEPRGGSGRSSGRSGCATWAGSSCSTSSTWRRRRTARRSSRRSSRSSGRTVRRRRPCRCPTSAWSIVTTQARQAEPGARPDRAVPVLLGYGVIKSSSTICYEILTEVKKISADLNGHGSCCA